MLVVDDQEPYRRAMRAVVEATDGFTFVVTVLTRDGVPAERAERLAWLIVGSLEGAVVMARSQRSPGPLEAVAEEARGLIRTAVTT